MSGFEVPVCYYRVGLNFLFKFFLFGFFFHAFFVRLPLPSSPTALLCSPPPLHPQQSDSEAVGKGGGVCGRGNGLEPVGC